MDISEVKSGDMLRLIQNPKTEWDTSRFKVMSDKDDGYGRRLVKCVSGHRPGHEVRIQLNNHSHGVWQLVEWDE